MDRAAAGVPPSVGLRPPYAETPAAILILIDARSGPDRRAALLLGRTLGLVLMRFLRGP
jgi:hypothetical protein